MADQPMTDEEAAEAIGQLDRADDIEWKGVEIDKVLVKLLRQLGYEQTATAYELAELWRG